MSNFLKGCTNSFGIWTLSCLKTEILIRTSDNHRLLVIAGGWDTSIASNPSISQANQGIYKPYTNWWFPEIYFRKFSRYMIFGMLFTVLLNLYWPSPIMLLGSYYDLTAKTGWSKLDTHPGGVEKVIFQSYQVRRPPRRCRKGDFSILSS